MTLADITLRRLRGQVPANMVRAALRMLWLDVRYRGVSTDEIVTWQSVACPFPHLRSRPEVTAIGELLEDDLLLRYSRVVACEPQIIWHLPQDKNWTLPPPHVDSEPPWAAGRKYVAIAGVALTPWNRANGALRYWPRQDARPRTVILRPGDVVVMHPSIAHASGLNLSSEVRCGLYYRWLAAESTATQASDHP